MHDYEYINKPEELLTPEVAKIQSTGASNRIEGIYTSDELDRLHWYNMEGNYNPADYDTDMARIVCKEYC